LRGIKIAKLKSQAAISDLSVHYRDFIARVRSIDAVLVTSREMTFGIKL